jgi:5-(carboxyamino)imidazole ribonucleotide mutase
MMKVQIILGSKSDRSQVFPAQEILSELKIPVKVNVASAHRTPEHVIDLAKNARSNGVKVIIAAAGGAAHLAGVIAAHTTLPVIALPIHTRLAGIDSLLSSTQMPAGIPLASVGIGGGKNAGLLAASILAVSDDKVAHRILEFRDKLTAKCLGDDVVYGKEYDGEGRIIE